MRGKDNVLVFELSGKIKVSGLIVVLGAIEFLFVSKNTQCGGEYRYTTERESLGTEGTVAPANGELLLILLLLLLLALLPSEGNGAG